MPHAALNSLSNAGCVASSRNRLMTAATAAVPSQKVGAGETAVIKLSSTARRGEKAGQDLAGFANRHEP